MLKLPGTKRLKLEHDGLLSNVGIKFNLRRYTVVDARDRFLKPGGLVLPNVATVHLALLSDQPRYDRSVTFWEDVYGFDFSSLIPQSKRYWSSDPPVVSVDPAAVVSDSAEVIRIDCAAVTLDELYDPMVGRCRLTR